MKRISRIAILGWFAATGCAAEQIETAPPVTRSAPATPPTVVQAGFIAEAPAGLVAVDDLVKLAVQRNPRLSQATFAIDAAQGRYIQAGLYPNPNLAANWDEIGDRTGAGGILNVPRFTQEIVTGHKLSLSQAVAATEINQANLDLLAERYSVIGNVRSAFYELYALENRVAILDELAKLAAEAAKNGKTLLDNKQIARLDLVQLEVEQARFQAEADAARKEVPALRKKLAAVVGDARLNLGAIAGPFHELPKYDPDQVLDAVLNSHPAVRTAKVGVERAQAALRRAEAEPIPNITFSTGYVRQYENQSHDFQLGLSAPIPTFNRNQGGIRAAKADLGFAIQAVGRAENDLAERVAAALRTYSAAMARAELYRKEILPKAEETYRLSLEAFKGGQFEYLRVIAAQRAIAEARLEYNRTMNEAWRGAAELSGLLLEEEWPSRSGGPRLNPEAGSPPSRD